jgi:hypothetical protein
VHEVNRDNKKRIEGVLNMCMKSLRPDVKGTVLELL